MWTFLVKDKKDEWKLIIISFSVLQSSAFPTFNTKGYSDFRVNIYISPVTFEWNSSDELMAGFNMATLVFVMYFKGQKYLMFCFGPEQVVADSAGKNFTFVYDWFFSIGFYMRGKFCFMESLLLCPFSNLLRFNMLTAKIIIRLQ